MNFNSENPENADRLVWGREVDPVIWTLEIAGEPCENPTTFISVLVPANPYDIAAPQ